jgi:hypothetical protein
MLTNSASSSRDPIFFKLCDYSVRHKESLSELKVSKVSLLTLESNFSTLLFVNVLILSNGPIFIKTQLCHLLGGSLFDTPLRGKES